MAIVTRDFAVRGNSVQLRVQYYSFDGSPSNADVPPEIEIKDLNGVVIVPRTTIGITNIGVGLYEYLYPISLTDTKGLWNDSWFATVNGVQLTDTFSILILDNPTAIAGSLTIGDDVVFDFSQVEIYGINILLKFLKPRLRSTGIKPVRDKYGSFVTDPVTGVLVTERCDVFTDEMLLAFLCQSLSEFNSTPFFTAFGFGDNVIQTLFAQIIVEGAYIYAMASQALVEKGRDFQITDGGVSFQPPALGDFLQSNYTAWLSSYRERVKFIKNSIRPGPVGYGTYTNLTSASPAISRLRHLRSRRII